MPEDKVPISEFAKRIKAKYPQYADINDTLLTQKMIEKYPEYRDMVDLGDIKKKDGGVTSQNGGEVGTSVPPSQGDKWKDFSFMPQNKKAFESDLDAHDPLLDAQNRADALREQPKSKEGFESFTKSSKAARDITSVVSRDGFVGDKFVSKVIGDDPNKYSVEQLLEKTKDNKTAQAAINGIADKRKVEEAISTTTDPYKAAIKYATGKENELQDNIPDEQKGEYVGSFLKNPNVIEAAKTNPEFGARYKEAKFNWMNDFPSSAQKDITQKIGQWLEDNGKGGMFNPDKESTDKAVDALSKSGDLDEHEAYIYKNKIKPNVGTTHSLLFGSPIPTSNVINQVSKSLERSGGNIVEGMRDAADNISLGTISKFGEDRAAHQKRILEGEFSQPQIEPQGEGKKFALGVADMVGFVVPAVLGEMAGVPTMATLATQFYGGNKVEGMKLYPEDENKQDAYAALTTGIDLIAGEKLPIKGIGQSLRGLIDEAAAGKITQAAAKNKYLGFINDVVKGGIKGANALEVMNIGHNAADAVFGGRKFDVEEQAKQVLNSYPKDFLTMALFSGVHAAAKGRETIKPNEQQQQPIEATKAGETTPEENIVSLAKENKLGAYSKMVEDNPSLAKDVLVDYAKQKYGIKDDGTDMEGGGRDIGVVDAAVTQKFPDKQSAIDAIKPKEETKLTIEEPKQEPSSKVQKLQDKRDELINERDNPPTKEVPVYDKYTGKQSGTEQQPLTEAEVKEHQDKINDKISSLDTKIKEETKKQEILDKKPALDDLPFLKSEEFDKAKDSFQMDELGAKQKDIKQKFKNLRKISECIWAI